MSNSTNISDLANTPSLTYIPNTKNASNDISMYNTPIDDSSLSLNSSLSTGPLKNNISAETPLNIPLISVIDPNKTNLIESVNASNNINTNATNSLTSPSAPI